MGNHITRSIAYQQRTLQAAMAAAGYELPREGAVRVVAELIRLGNEVGPVTPEAVAAYHQAKWMDQAAPGSDADSDPVYREYLRRGLIGPEHEHQWRNSLSFRRAIEELVRMLPAMINGLALAAVRADEDIARRIMVAKMTPPNGGPLLAKLTEDKVDPRGAREDDDRG